MALRKRSPKVTPTENPRVSEAGSSAAAPVGRPAPTPVAKRRVGGVAVAVALAALGGLGAFVGTQANEAKPYLVVNAPVERGQKIESSMLSSVRVAGDPSVLVPATEAQQIQGQVATTDLQPGSTITRTSTATSLGVEDGESLVGLALEVGRLPAREMVAGDHVQVLFTPGNQNTQAGDESQNHDPVAAVIEASHHDQNSGKTTVDLRVKQADAQKVATWGAAGTASVIMQGAQK